MPPTIRKATKGPFRTFAIAVSEERTDSIFAGEVADYLKLDHRTVAVSDADLLEPETRRRVVDSYDCATNMGDAYISLYLLFRATARHAKVALSGEGADELFGGYRQFHDPALVNAETFPWLPLRGATPQIFKPEVAAALDPRILCA